MKSIFRQHVRNILFDIAYQLARGCISPTGAIVSLIELVFTEEEDYLRLEKSNENGSYYG